ncbi:MAG: YkvA family protein [Solirubrobacterales bacterium]
MSLLAWSLISVASLILFWGLAVAVLVGLGRREDARALIRFIPDCVLLFRALLGEAAMPPWRKLILLGVVAYLIMPIDLVPDFIPVAGQLDDAIVVLLGLRTVLRGSNRALLAAHWPGPPESLAVLERFAFGKDKTTRSAA